MSTWQILTWFKNKTPTFFTFQNFYNKYWDINNFIYCIGYTSKENKQYILNNYFNKLEETRNIKYGNLLPLLVMDVEMITGSCNEQSYQIFLYKTSVNCPLEKWSAIKRVFEKLIIPNIHNKDRLLMVDDDEFLYSKNIKQIKNRGKGRFHFIDFVPDKHLDKNNLMWSIQGWSHTHCQYSEKGESWKTYYCGGCKLYTFTKGNNWSHYHHHGGKDVRDSPVCSEFAFRTVEAIKLEKKTDDDLIHILEGGVCFHFISLTRGQLLQIKQKNRHNIEGNWVKQFQKTNKLIYKNLRVIKYNLLADSISDKDIELI